jgi:hypothetical protein
MPTVTKEKCHCDQGPYARKSAETNDDESPEHASQIPAVDN